MKRVTYTTTKLVLSKEEKAIKKTWNDSWKAMRKMEDTLGYIVILTATWSGYSGQNNCDTTSLRHASFVNDSIHPYTGIIEFSDGTELNVRTEKMTIEYLLEKGISKNEGYSKSIARMIQDGKGYLSLNED